MSWRRVMSNLIRAFSKSSTMGCAGVVIKPDIAALKQTATSSFKTHVPKATESIIYRFNEKWHCATAASYKSKDIRRS